MSRISEIIEKSQVFTTLDTFKNLLVNIKPEEYANEAVINEIIRVNKVINYIDSILSSIDHDLVALTTLNNINQHLNSSYSQFNTFVTNGNLANLNTCNDQLSNTLPLVASLNILNTKNSAKVTERELKKLNLIVEDFVLEFTNNKKIISAQTKSYEENIKKLEEKIDVQVNRLDKVISEFQEVFQENQQNRTSEFNILIKEHENNLNLKTDEYINSASKKIDIVFDGINSHIKDFEKSSENILLQLESDKDKSSNLLKVIANIGTTGQFNKYSKSEERSYYIFTSIAVIFMSIAIFLSFKFLINVSTDINLISSIAKIFTLSLFFAPATYSVKEAAKHRRKQTYYRKMELELATIDTFIENLSQENREEVKLELTRRLFGNHIDLDSSEKGVKNKADEISIQDIANLLKDLGIKKDSLFELIKYIK